MTSWANVASELLVPVCKWHCVVSFLCFPVPVLIDEMQFQNSTMENVMPSSRVIKECSVQFRSTLKYSKSSMHHENTPIYFLPPLTPLLYSKTGVYRDIHYFSYFCSKHTLWVLVRTHNLCFEQNYEKYPNFLSEKKKNHILVVNFFSIFE